jgi:hypothetical protein
MVATVEAARLVTAVWLALVGLPGLVVHMHPASTCGATRMVGSATRQPEPSQLMLVAT